MKQLTLAQYLDISRRFPYLNRWYWGYRLRGLWSKFRELLTWLCLGWHWGTVGRRGKQARCHRVVHECGDIHRGVDIYDSPARWWKKWTKRRRDANYREPVLLIDRNGIKTNPNWNRDLAYPVIR